MKSGEMMWVCAAMAALLFGAVACSDDTNGPQVDGGLITKDLSTSDTV